MISSESEPLTRKAWRKLGFYYERDDNSHFWIIIGTKSGVNNFSRIIKEYTTKEKHKILSEHEHYGPYMSLEIGTWEIPVINNHWIAGPLPELLQLSEKIDELLENAKPQDEIQIENIFAPDAEYGLKIIIQDEGYDPSASDQYIK